MPGKGDTNMWLELSLLKKGLVSVEDLLEAVERQRSSQIPLGRLAVQSGKMRMPQVCKVLKVQADSPKPFGRIAVEMGFLSEPDLAQLLLHQSEQVKSVGEYLVELGAISSEQFETERRLFQHNVKVASTETDQEELDYGLMQAISGT